MDVKRVAKLSNLALTESEEKKFLSELQKIVDYMDILNEVDTSDAPETSQTTNLTNVTRKDEPKQFQGMKVEDAISNATNVHNNYFVVDRLINEEA